jgi:glycogen debranching enzyme
LTLSLAWVTASASFAELARLTGHVALADQATTASRRARDAVRPAYYDARRGSWASGHLRSGVPVEGLTSSAIALLHQGLLSEREQQSLVAELVSSAYRAPWGIRSTPNNSPFYDPDSYARGSVWALGTADAIRAFYEANRADVGTTLWRDLVPWFALDAPGHMHEVLRGDTFAPERESVPDQTWSSASFISSTVRGMLGIRLDGAKRTIRFAPHLPAEWDSLHVRRVDLGGSVVALALRSSPGFVDLEIENSGPAMTLTFQPTLRSGARIGNVEVSGGASVVSRDSTEVTIRCPAKQASHVRLRLSS